MATNVGGMRHIGVAAGLTDQVCGEVRNLDEQSQNEVLKYIATLKQNRPTQTPDEKIGTVEALRNHIGRWSFSEGERDRLTQELYKLRRGEG